MAEHFTPEQGKQKSKKFAEVEGEGLANYATRMAPIAVDSDVEAEYFGTSFSVPRGSDVGTIMTLWGEADKARRAAYAVSPEGQAAVRVERAEIAEVQAQVDTVINELSGLNFLNFEQVLDWLQNLSKLLYRRVGVTVDKEMILNKFADNGYLPKRYPKDENKNKVGRLLDYLSKIK